MPFVEEELRPLEGSGEEPLVVTCQRRMVQSGFHYVLAASPDLSQWDDAPYNFEEIDVVDDGNGITETVQVRALHPPFHYDKIFVTLRVARD